MDEYEVEVRIHVEAECSDDAAEIVEEMLHDTGLEYYGLRAVKASED